MLCRTSALQQVKGFDADFFLYFEDFDLSLRLGN
jgi:GT2 family glycosyltransferase